MTLTQLDSVGPLSILPAQLSQGGKGHRQEVFDLPCGLAGPGYLGQLHKTDESGTQTEDVFKYLMEYDIGE